MKNDHKPDHSELVGTIKWQTIFNAIEHPAIILDPDHRIVAANSASSRLTGIPGDEIIGRYCHEVFHRYETGAPPADCPMNRIKQSEAPESISMEMETVAGIFMVCSMPVLTDDGRLDKLIHIATDITASRQMEQKLAAELEEHKKLESALIEQQNFIRSLIMNSTGAIFVLDHRHRVQIWNKACENLTGFSQADMIGSEDQWRAFYSSRQPTLADVILDGEFDKLPTLCSQVSKSRNIPNGFKAEGWFEQINGKDRYLTMEAAPIYDSLGNMTHVVESISDITDNKALEEQLLHSQKMESIGQLAGGIAHEFNNILAVIMGYGQVMRDGFQPGSVNMSDIDQILTATDRATTLTKGLLAFSRKQHVLLKNIDVSIPVHTTLKSFSRIMGDDVIINENPAGAPLIIHADQGLVTQVLMNLMANARDAMPNGGTLDISAGSISLDKPYLHPLCTIPPGKYARITLSDSGHGIDDITIQKIFEPFFTTKDIGKGTGLGLSVVYGIVSQHNGYILVNSEVGHGTTFDLYFPLVEQQDAKSPALATSASLTTGDETILLADDDPVLLGMFCEILSEKGYSVITATDGVDAVAKFAANPDSFDLLVLDVQMRWKSGLQAFKEIKQIRPACRALFVSGFNEDQFCDDMELEEGSELLAKPFKPIDLAARVRKMLDDITLSNSTELL